MLDAPKSSDSAEELLRVGTSMLWRARLIVVTVIVAAMAHFTYLVWPFVLQVGWLRGFLILAYPLSLAALLVRSFFRP